MGNMAMKDLYADSANAYQKFQQSALYLFLLPCILVVLTFTIALTPFRIIDIDANRAMHGLDVEATAPVSVPSLTPPTSGIQKESSEDVVVGVGISETNDDQDQSSNDN